MVFSNTVKPACLDKFNLVSTTLHESKANFEASTYIADNYSKIIGKIRSLGIKEEKANDLLHDLYINLYTSEKEGEGFDSEYGDGNMTVEQFVFARINGYAKNEKYRTDVVDSKKTTVERLVTITDSDDFGTGKVKQRTVKVKDTVYFSSVASTTLNDELEDNDGFQTAYSLAAVSDCSDDIDGALSLREQINTCIDICDLNGIQLINILKNIDRLGEVLIGKKSSGVFQKLSDLVKESDVLSENLLSVIEFRKSNREVFEQVVESL